MVWDGLVRASLPAKHWVMCPDGHGGRFVVSMPSIVTTKAPKSRKASAVEAEPVDEDSDAVGS